MASSSSIARQIPVPDQLLDEENAAAQAQVHRPTPPTPLGPAHSGVYTLACTFVSAGFGNAISAAVTNPTDIVCVLASSAPFFWLLLFPSFAIDALSVPACLCTCRKVRQQLLLDRTRASFLSIGAEMARTEGVRSLFNGVTASCLRELSYSTIRMGSYESFKVSPVFSAIYFLHWSCIKAPIGSVASDLEGGVTAVWENIKAPNSSCRPVASFTQGHKAKLRPEGDCDSARKHNQGRRESKCSWYEKTGKLRHRGKCMPIPFRHEALYSGQYMRCFVE